MAKRQYPQRHENHNLEEASNRFFAQHLPRGWNSNPVKQDYGQDLHIEIAQDGEYRGLELIVQLKSSAVSNVLNGNERQTFKVSTFNYLRDNLRVVMVVKFVEAENEAYWMLLRDVPVPNQDHETFTMYITRQNTLSTIIWNDIVAYIAEITGLKLDAVRNRQGI